MAHSYTNTNDFIRDARRFELDPADLIRTGAYRRTASGMLVACLEKAPKTYVL